MLRQKMHPSWHDADLLDSEGKIKSGSVYLGLTFDKGDVEFIPLR